MRGGRAPKANQEPRNPCQLRYRLGSKPTLALALVAGSDFKFQKLVRMRCQMLRFQTWSFLDVLKTICGRLPDQSGTLLYALV